MNINNIDILLIIAHLGNGGSQRVITNLACYWSNHKYQVAVLIASPSPEIQNREPTKLEQLLIDKGIQLEWLKDPLPLPQWRICQIGLFNAIYRFMKIEGIRSIYKRIMQFRGVINRYQPKRIVSFIAITNIVTILAATGKKIPVCISERNDPKLQSHGKLWDVFRILFYRRADVVTANSHGAIKTMSRYVPKRKLHFVPNPVYIEQRNCNKTSQVERIFTAGRLVPQKGYDVLLSALKDILKQYPHIKLIMFGDGPEKDNLQNLSREFGIDHHIEWKGHIENPWQFYCEGDIFVQPSRFEGSPNSLIEAMLLGMVVITSDASPGLTELVEHEVSGLVVPVDDIAALEKALESVIKSEELRTKFSENAKRAAEPYQVDSAMKIWSDVINLNQLNK